jgi:GNAT superfamily N-acetyltransferase
VSASILYVGNPDDDDFEFDDRAAWEWWEDAERIFKLAGIRPSNAEDILILAIDDSTLSSVGALQFGLSGDCWSFSAAVADGRRRQGIANMLLNAYRESVVDVADAYGRSPCGSAWVVSPAMAKLLEKRGWDGDWSEGEPHMEKHW